MLLAVDSRSEGITRLLRAAADGDQGAGAELLPLVYDDLKDLAHVRLARFGGARDIQTTDLVHEAWLRLLRHADPGWEGRRHFFGAAARAMRNILVEQTRRQLALKRDGVGRVEAGTDLPAVRSAVPVEDVISLGEALDRFQLEHPQAAEVVWLRFFNGFTMPEVAEVIGLSLATAERDWRFAKAWLRQVLEREPPE
jgi:RNA polymerase sigma factor (TIGR02999 family)